MLHLKPPLAFDLSSGQLKKKERDQKSLVIIEKKSCSILLLKATTLNENEI
jgi:hypothetical protein